MTARKNPSRPAAAVVEFALVLPFLVTCLLGMFEVSRAILVKETLSNAVQRACRTGSLPGKSNTDLTQDVSDILSTQKINGYTVTVKINGVAGDVKDAKRNDMVSVSVSVPVANVFWVSTYFVKATMVESQTVVMLRQG